MPEKIIDQGISTALLYIGQASWPNPVNYQKLEKLLNNSPQHSSILMPGTKHFDFSDTPLFSPLMQIAGLAGTIPANELATDLEDKIVSFFNLHLKDH